MHRPTDSLPPLSPSSPLAPSLSLPPRAPLQSGPPALRLSSPPAALRSISFTGPLLPPRTPPADPPAAFRRAIIVSVAPRRPQGAALVLALCAVGGYEVDAEASPRAPRPEGSSMNQLTDRASAERPHDPAAVETLEVGDAPQLSPFTCPACPPLVLASTYLRIERNGAPLAETAPLSGVAAAVAARHQARLLAEIGRQNRDPQPLLEAAQLLSRFPAGRPASWLGPARLLRGDTELPGIAWTPPSVRDAPIAADLRAEARALGVAVANPRSVADEDPVGGPGLPALRCGHLSPGLSAVFRVHFPADETAAAALFAHPQLRLTVRDEGGTAIGSGVGATLLRFRPRWRAEFLLSVDNDSGSRQGFCVETSAGPEPLRVEPGAGAQPGPAGG